MRAPDRMKAWRAKHGHTQAVAANLVGVSQASWCDWENEKKTPQMEQGLKLERATNGDVPVSSWFEADEAEESSPGGSEDTDVRATTVDVLDEGPSSQTAALKASAGAPR